jgi:hypothetical protein
MGTTMHSDGGTFVGCREISEIKKRINGLGRTGVQAVAEYSLSVLEQKGGEGLSDEPQSYKPNFTPEFESTASNLDPHYSGDYEFDYEAVDRELTGASAGLPDEDKALLAEGLARVVRWIIGQPKGSYRDRKLQARRYSDQIARRACALAWVVNPSWFEGSPTLSELGQHLGISKSILSKHTSEVTGVFGIQNRAQCQGAWRRQDRAAAKAKYQKEERHAE